MLQNLNISVDLSMIRAKESEYITPKLKKVLHSERKQGPSTNIISTVQIK